MADYPEDLAKGIAENIGVMPLVTKAGEAGSGFMNFLASLLPGGTAASPAKGGGGAPPAAPSQKGGGYLSFLSSLFQPTVDAFQEDVDALRGPEWKLPPQATKTAGQVLNAMGNPAVNPVAPTMMFQKMLAGPEGPGQFLMQAGKPQTVPGGDWLTLMMRQGNFGPLLEFLMKGVDKVPR